MMKRCRCLGVKQTHSRHRGNDANDPQQNSRPTTGSSDSSWVQPRSVHRQSEPKCGAMGKIWRGQQPATWASMIERQIESPILIPPALVVKKALNSRPAFSAAIPTPQSVTLTNTCCVSYACVLRMMSGRPLLGRSGHPSEVHADRMRTLFA
jgi:hypothetical protein